MGAELVAIGRVAISEPEWPQRAVEGTVRHRVPVRDLGTVLTVPRGLAEKIEGTPGWFEAEEE
jgi:2,4-dienoyl-CoA reductase-like NADH-dependent reductase (Old Yellow Enzyme family)